MAKAANRYNAPASALVENPIEAFNNNASTDDFEWVDDLPTSTRGGGGAKASETLNMIKSIPAPRTSAEGKQQFARKWFELTDRAPDTITDPAERAKADKENLRKLTNKLSGITRRLTKQDSNANYTLRSVEQNGKPGVAVYRIGASAAAASAGEAAGPVATE